MGFVHASYNTPPSKEKEVPKTKVQKIGDQFPKNTKQNVRLLRLALPSACCFLCPEERAAVVTTGWR